MIEESIQRLSGDIEGHIDSDYITRISYSTDASAYREMPLAVAFPKTTADVVKLVCFAKEHGISLIPRAAGTSLAGQVVGDGIVLDVSRYMNTIIDINAEEKWVDVQPGVVLDELNIALKDYGLFFAPETSTSNRCCIGGMMGNNSCGSHSVRYGSTREHLLEIEMVLSDGSVVDVCGMSKEDVEHKKAQDTLEGKIYRHLYQLLSNEDNREELKEQSPDMRLGRRNNGYALDLMMYNQVFDADSNDKFNLCKLMAGSEGTLGFATKLRLNLEPLPPRYKAVICMHCRALEESFHANLVALRHAPVAVELMDSTILKLSEKNISQRANRFFIEGQPAAILIIELAEDSQDILQAKIEKIEHDMRAEGYGYAYPVLIDDDISRVWNLRKAGLGLLSNMVGSAKPVSVIEDTAVVPERLPEYLGDISEMLRDMGLECVYHAHIATGELHLRPILNLKEDSDKLLFREVATRTAHIVKKYRGSISGEHGDGRLRGEFIPIMFGEKVYAMFKELKKVFDPHDVFNKGKIIDTPPMDDCLRYMSVPIIDEMESYFSFENQGNFINAVEQCNGAGDCRKSVKFAGVMCPAFKASGSETDTTRARANMMRSMLYELGREAFEDDNVIAVLKNCLSCKACKSECPSNVDMTKLKAEFMQHHYDKSGLPLCTRLVGMMPQMYALAQIAPWAYNYFASNRVFSRLVKKLLKFAPERELPRVAPESLKSWMRGREKCIDRYALVEIINENEGSIRAERYDNGNEECVLKEVRKIANREIKGRLYLFADEFTNHLDVEVGKCFVDLMDKLGYEVVLPKHVQSGRTTLSKGMVRDARKFAKKNVDLLHDIVGDDMPLVGLEPSTILTFRDEYIDLLRGEDKEKAERLSKNVMLYDEFILREIERGNISSDSFVKDKQHVMLHGHCHQKTLASVVPSKKIIELPENYSCEIIQSGCCGMAGSYGYEKEHYASSMSIAEEVLLPAVRRAKEDVVVSAPGTSCREQIKNGTGKTALHPVEVLHRALCATH